MILGILASAIRAANAALSYDPYFDKVTALLHLDGADGSTTITDVTGRVWGAYSGAKLGTANPKFGTAALDLVGQASGEANTTRLFTEAKNHTFGSRDFTVELFARQNRVDARAGVLAAVDYEDSGSSSAWRAWSIAIDGNGRPYARISSDGTSFTKLLANAVVPVEGYYHYALVRKGGLVRLFVDGVQAAEATFTGSMWESPIGMTIGSWATATSEAFKGQIDEFRITDGLARYWDDFKPPTKAFYDTGAPKPTDPLWDYVSLLMHFDAADGSNTFSYFSKGAVIDPSDGFNAVYQRSQQSKFGGTSLKAEDTSGKLNFAAHASLALPMQFTIEFWMYPTATDVTGYMLGAGSRYFTINGEGTLLFYGFGGALVLGNPVKNAWTHVAVSRDSSGNLRAFLNGKVVASTTSNAVDTDPQKLGIVNIPGNANAAAFYMGYIDEVRVTVGATRYTAEFPPPTAAFPDK